MVYVCDGVAEKRGGGNFLLHLYLLKIDIPLKLLVLFIYGKYKFSH